MSHDRVQRARGFGASTASQSNGAVSALMLRNTDRTITEDGQFEGAMGILTDPAYRPDCDTDVKDWSLAALDTQPARIATANLRADPGTDRAWCFDARMSRVVRTLIASGQGLMRRAATATARTSRSSATGRSSSCAPPTRATGRPMR